MSFSDTIETRSLIAASRRASTKKGDQYHRVVFFSLARQATTAVTVSRVTKNCIYFTDGLRMRKDTGSIIQNRNFPPDSMIAVSYIAA